MAIRTALRLPTRREIADVSRLAAPIAVVQVGLMFMGVVDTAMVGRVSPTDLAAVALGNFYWINIVIFGQGTLMALDPVVAQAVGAGDQPAIARGLQRGLIMAIALSLLSAILMLPVGPALRLFGQPVDVIPIAARYVWVLIPSLFPYFLFVVARQTLQAMHQLRAIVLAMLVGNVVNVALNWVFVYGHLGSPPLGAFGSAISTTIGRFIMAGMLLADAWPQLAPFVRPWRPESLFAAPLARMLRLGLPIGVHSALEIAAFGTALLLIGRLGTIPLAGHEVTITLAALTYMVPLGTSAAAAVLVGRAIGRGDPEGARREASAALVCGVGFMACTAVTFLAIPGMLARLFTTDATVFALATALIPIAGVFQVFDGIQGVSTGILRGAGDTQTPMLVNLVGYFAVGIPIGSLLTFGLGLGPQGMWWGLVAGLAAVAIALGLRVRWRMGGELRRVQIDHEADSAA